MARVTTDGSVARVRNGPGLDYAVVGVRSSGDFVDVLEHRAGWARIGTIQWISETLLTETHEGPDVIPHDDHPNDPNYRLLVNFRSNSSALRAGHRDWLSGTASQQRRAGLTVWVRGMASHLGEPEPNQALSERRAQAVHDFLVEQCGIRSDQVRGLSASVGEGWASGSATDDSGRWRAVEVRFSNDFEPPHERNTPTMIQRRVEARLSSNPHTLVAPPQGEGEAAFERAMQIREGNNARFRLRISTRPIPSNQQVFRIVVGTDVYNDGVVEARTAFVRFEWGRSASDPVLTVFPHFSTYISRHHARAIYTDPLPLLMDQEANPFANGGSFLAWLNALAGTANDHL